MKNPIKEYKRLKRIVDYYEDNMLAMQRCRRYAEFGLLLLSNVQPGDRIYLIGAQLLIFQKPLCCRVEKVFVFKTPEIIARAAVRSPAPTGGHHTASDKADMLRSNHDRKNVMQQTLRG